MVAKKQSDESVEKADDPAKQAFQVMLDVRTALHKRLVKYVLQNAEGLREEAHSTDGYNFLHQQMDEQILAKLCTASRALGELNIQPEMREPQQLMTTYEAVEVTARREDMPQKIADALAEHSDSDFLNMSVIRADDQHAEILLLLARQDTGQAAATVQPAAEARARGDQSEPGDQGGPSGQSGQSGQSGSIGSNGNSEN